LQISFWNGIGGNPEMARRERFRASERRAEKKKWGWG
jgi:hypothetical protein